jgi:hypothetical protein
VGRKNLHGAQQGICIDDFFSETRRVQDKEEGCTALRKYQCGGGIFFPGDKRALEKNSVGRESGVERIRREKKNQIFILFSNFYSREYT